MTAAPHSLQNLAFGRSSVPHDPHNSPVAVSPRHQPRCGPRHYRVTAGQRCAHIATDTEHAKNTLFQLGARHRNSTRSSPYTSAMFSETRYALNGDLRVAYRASREGPRDIVFVPNWFTCCEVFPELPSLQGWVEAMTSLGRLIFFDQPGTGASDPVTPGALPTLEQWADSITAVLDDLGSREAVLLAVNGAFAPAALFAATHPSRTTALVVLEGYADPIAERTDGLNLEEIIAAMAAMWGTGEYQHVMQSGHAVERGDPGNVGTTGTPGGQPRDRCSHDASVDRNGRAGGASHSPRAHPRRPPHRRPDSSRPRWASTSPITYRARNTLSCRGATCTTSLNRGGTSFQEIAEFLTGHQAEVADDRVLATVLFTDIVDSTRRAAEMGDRDWHALLDAHDAVVRSQLARFRGREVNTSGDGFLAMFDGPQRAIRCAMAIRDAVQSLGIEVRAGLHTGECEVRGDDIGGIAVHIGARVSALAGPNDVLVSSTLRDLVIGSGLEFEDRGAHELKGVPGEWRLFAVDG